MTLVKRYYWKIDGLVSLFLSKDEMLHNPDDDYIIITFHDSIFSLNKKNHSIDNNWLEHKFDNKKNKKSKMQIPIFRVACCVCFLAIFQVWNHTVFFVFQKVIIYSSSGISNLGTKFQYKPTEALWAKYGVLCVIWSSIIVQPLIRLCDL